MTLLPLFMTLQPLLHDTDAIVPAGGTGTTRRQDKDIPQAGKERPASGKAVSRKRDTTIAACRNAPPLVRPAPPLVPPTPPARSACTHAPRLHSSLHSGWGQGPRWARKAARSNNHLLTTIVQRLFGVTLLNFYHFLLISLTCSHFVSLTNMPIISALPRKVREVIEFYGKDNGEWTMDNGQWAEWA